MRRARSLRADTYQQLASVWRLIWPSEMNTDENLRVLGAGCCLERDTDEAPPIEVTAGIPEQHSQAVLVRGGGLPSA